MKRRWTVLVLVAVLAACGKKEEPSPKPQGASSPQPVTAQPDLAPPTEERLKTDPEFRKWFTNLSGSAQRAWIAGERKLPFELARQRRDQAELVRPAPPGFKPGNAARKVKLTLIPRQAKIKAGESFWYRAEMQNIGKETIHFGEMGISFFKTGGSMRSTKFHFDLTGPDGETFKMPGYPPMSSPMRAFSEYEVKFPAHFTEAQKAEAFQRMKDESVDPLKLIVDLAPGETLVTRSWRFIHPDDRTAMRKRGEDPHAPISGEFRELRSDYKFKTPGIYRIRIVLNNPMPMPPTAQKLRDSAKFGLSAEDEDWFYRLQSQQSLGIVKSNSISFEVVE